MTFKIRRALIEDAGSIAEAHVATWKLLYRNLIEPSYLDGMSVEARKTKWQDSLSHTGSEYIVYVLENDEGIIGFANFGVPDSASRPLQAELYAIYLYPDYHGQGAGSALFKACRDEVRNLGCQKFSCWVFKAYAQGHEFYKRMGGRLISKSEKQLVVGERAYPIVSYEWIL